MEKFTTAAWKAYASLKRGALLRGNAKLDKNQLGEGAEADYLITGLTLAPHALSGMNVCGAETKGCAKACVLWFAGQRVTPQARARALADTVFAIREPDAFRQQLHDELERFARRARRSGRTPLVRLNVASDRDYSDVIREHADITFFDYTKRIPRFEAFLRGELPNNYHLTFSASEATRPELWAKYCRGEGFARRGNVAAAFNVAYHSGGRYAPWVKGELPSYVEWAGRTILVADGDKHDVRLPWIDGEGVCVALRLKGTNKSKAAAVRTGFALDAIGQQHVA